MASADQREDMMDLARRALAHCLNQTTTTETIMTMPIKPTDEKRYQAERNRIFSSLPIAGALSIELPRQETIRQSVLEKPLLLPAGMTGKLELF